MSARSLLLQFGVLLTVSACEGAPYGDVLNGKACSAAGECAPGYQCIEGACLTTWLVLGGDDDAPPLGLGGSGGSPATGGLSSDGGSPAEGGAASGGGDCVANGNCPPTLAQGTSCSATAQCISGYCVDGVCCESSCAAANETCDATGTCVCTDCGLPPGSPCATDGQCASGKCADEDGICCDDDCNGTCLSCRGSETGSSDGQCAAILFELDPENECQGNDKCDGEGGCVECDGNDCGDD